jgi:hypothetical protein
MSASGKSFEPVFVPPLRSPTARKRAKIQAQLAWRRTAVRLLIGGIVAAAMVRVGAIALEPLVVTYRSGREIRTLESQYRSELARRNRLQQEIRFLSTTAGVEEEARRLGWVRTGETSLQVLMPPEAEADRRANAPRPKASGSERVRQWLETWLSALNRAPAKEAKPGK